MSANPLQTIAQSPMRLQQYVVVALCCLINITEGYDVVSMAYAAPVLSKDWGTPAEVIGLIFSAASFGLMLGAFFIAPLADRIGRRNVMLLALAAITVSHLFSAIAGTVYVLAAMRFLMGLGLGTLVVSLNVMVSEYTSDRQRNMLLSVLHTGFTIGMMLGGLLAALVLEPFGWRAIFVFGTAMNIVLLLVLLLFLKESPTFLLNSQPRNALAKINRIMTGLGHPPLEQLPPRPEKGKRGSSLAALLAPDQRSINLLLWLASLTYAIVGYFLLNWKPQVLVNAGLTPTQAGWGGILEGALGMLGHLAMGVLTRNGGAVRMTALFFVMLGVCLVIFGNLQAGPIVLISMSGLLKFFTVGAYTGVFLVAVALYPTATRTVGLGLVVGFGRLGAIIGPLLGGLLLGADIGRASTFAVFAAISAVPAITMILVSRLADRRPVATTVAA